MRVLVTLTLLVVLGGCAGTTVTPVGTTELDATANGIRYYEAAPFLLVYSDGKGGLVSELKFLPDVTTKRSIDPFAVLAQNETTLTFTDGVLSESKAVIDETVVPKSIITALEKVATAAMGLASADDPTGNRQVDVPLPRLYRIVITANDVSLEGGRVFNSDGVELTTLRATISQPGKAPAAAAAAAAAPGVDDPKKDPAKDGGAK